MWAFVRVRMVFDAHAPAPLTATPTKAPAAAREAAKEIASIEAASVAWTVTGPVVMSVQPWAASYVCVLRFSVPADAGELVDRAGRQLADPVAGRDRGRGLGARVDRAVGVQDRGLDLVGDGVAGERHADRHRDRRTLAGEGEGHRRGAGESGDLRGVERPDEDARGADAVRAVAVDERLDMGADDVLGPHARARDADADVATDGDRGGGGDDDRRDRLRRGRGDLESARRPRCSCCWSRPSPRAVRAFRRCRRR